MLRRMQEEQEKVICFFINKKRVSRADKFGEKNEPRRIIGDDEATAEKGLYGETFIGRGCYNEEGCRVYW